MERPPFELVIYPQGYIPHCMSLLTRWLKSATTMALVAILAMLVSPSQMACQCQAALCHEGPALCCDDDAVAPTQCVEIGAACHCQTAAHDIAFVNSDTAHFDGQPLLAVLPVFTFALPTASPSTNWRHAVALLLRSPGLGPPSGRGPPALA